MSDSRSDVGQKPGLRAGARIPIRSDRTKLEQVHVFEAVDVEAIHAALGAKRPLLVRGEPGVGKSQLAQAAAVALERVFVPFVVDARTEARELLWREDAVARLADAQLIAALGSTSAVETDDADSGEPDAGSGALALRRRLSDPTAYVEPGPLWWAFDWTGAVEQAARLQQVPRQQGPEANPENGAVVLIDEIDKAEADVPNGLLEALGASQFTPRGWARPVVAEKVPPLIVITTNEERVLPDAFLRRCVVHEITLPDAAETQAQAAPLIKYLVERGRAHFPDVHHDVLQSAAGYLNEDRWQSERERRRPAPGQAEYLDLVRAAIATADVPTSPEPRREADRKSVV